MFSYVHTTLDSLKCDSSTKSIICTVTTQNCLKSIQYGVLYVLAWIVASHFLSGSKIAPSISRDGISRIIKKESGLVLENALDLWNLFLWDEPAYLGGLAHFTGLAHSAPALFSPKIVIVFIWEGGPAFPYKRNTNFMRKQYMLLFIHTSS